MKTEIYTIEPCFDLAQTLDCGQAFRWKPVDGCENAWHGVAYGKYLKLEQKSDAILLYCSEEDYKNIWHDYFDLSEDYAEKRAALSAMSEAIREAAEFAPGIRILRQEPWEALCSFIISQNNNIPRIKGIIERLCELLGEKIGEDCAGFPVYSFPTAQKLCEQTVESLAPLRSGFRAKYLIDAAQKIISGEVDMKKAALSPVEDSRKELQKIKGVGPKVADCALLYGLHRTECFPMDVWMKRAAEVLLPGRDPAEFGENAGLAQQYIFHYSRMHPELFKI